MEILVGAEGSVVAFLENPQPQRLEDLFLTLYRELPASLRDHVYTSDALLRTMLAPALLHAGVHAEVEVPVPGGDGGRRADVAAQLDDNLTIVF